MESSQIENIEAPANTLKQDERIMAALSHGAILLPMTGAIVPIVIWVTQKDKSPYIAFQALQALVYHLLLLLLYMIGMGCYLGSFFGMLLVPGFLDPGGAEMPLGFIFPIGVMFSMFCGGGLYMLLGIVAAILTAMGKEFRYPIIGDFIKKRQQNLK